MIILEEPDNSLLTFWSNLSFRKFPNILKNMTYTYIGVEKTLLREILGISYDMAIE